MSLFIRVALPGFRHQCKKWDCEREQRVTRFYSWFVSGSIEATDSTGNTKGATIAQQNQTKFRRNAREKRDQKKKGREKVEQKRIKIAGWQMLPRQKRKEDWRSFDGPRPSDLRWAFESSSGAIRYKMTMVGKMVERCVCQRPLHENKICWDHLSPMSIRNTSLHISRWRSQSCIDFFILASLAVATSFP